MSIVCIVNGVTRLIGTLPAALPRSRIGTSSHMAPRLRNGVRTRRPRDLRYFHVGARYDSCLSFVQGRVVVLCGCCCLCASSCDVDPGWLRLLYGLLSWSTDVRAIADTGNTWPSHLAGTPVDRRYHSEPRRNTQRDERDSTHWCTAGAR